MGNSTIDAMLDNHSADSFTDVQEQTTPVFDDENESKLTRLRAYVDNLFMEYPWLENYLNRNNIQVCIANWDSTRGQAYPFTQFSKDEFGKRIHHTHKHNSSGHAMVLARGLVGATPELDNGIGWKHCVRHELGHVYDFGKRGKSDHSKQFKKTMAKFSHHNNNGQSAHGKRPDYLRQHTE